MYSYSFDQDALRQAITDHYREDEASAVARLLPGATLTTEQREAVREHALSLVAKVREEAKTGAGARGANALMHEFSLSSTEGVALMCLAEALLRVPDTETRQKLIQDKLAIDNWANHISRKSSLFINATAWSLTLTGKILTPAQKAGLPGTLKKLLKSVSLPVIQYSTDVAMKMLGQQFVTGESIVEALENIKPRFQRGFRYSFDMLGEAAMTQADADRYFKDYIDAITQIGQDAQSQENLQENLDQELIVLADAVTSSADTAEAASSSTEPSSTEPSSTESTESSGAATPAAHNHADFVPTFDKVGPYVSNGISVKLSAIHPRYSRAQRERVLEELLPRLKQLYLLAKKYNIGLSIDAEEANRLELSLDLFQAIVEDADFDGFNGLGIVVQAYSKRCSFVLDWLIALARRTGKRIMIRLVKGAYWDSEIKWAQLEGLDHYPVFTRKHHTDVSYVANARKLLQNRDAVFPQFATHNALTLATVNQLAKDTLAERQEANAGLAPEEQRHFPPRGYDFEFQCLHGMGESLYDHVADYETKTLVRVYAPVGTHETLLAYLVRRLLENGANSSFVNLIVDPEISDETLVRDPTDLVRESEGYMNKGIPLPGNLYPDRKNSFGFDLSNENTLGVLSTKLAQASQQAYHAESLLAPAAQAQTADAPADAPAVQEVLNPADHSVVGTQAFSRPDVVEAVVSAALASTWGQTPVEQRAQALEKFADLLETHYFKLLYLAINEAGKTLPNAIAEVREAVDFCRYYALEARKDPTAQPLGVVVAISPWNFPLAIFVGQVVASLVAGNSVIAKPAEQTSLIAHYAVKLLHQAGVPTDALQLVLGAGDVGAALTQDPRIAGVVFTGSTAVAQAINHTLKLRNDNPVLIAETGGQNAMVVDSTALPEQVCTDVLSSAFDSAGQRCSALRLLLIQEDVADAFIKIIKGAMAELRVGDPRELNTDVGPVIDAEAQGNLLKHIRDISTKAKFVYKLNLDDTLKGTFVAPHLIELENLDALEHEVFGPVLHVLRYKAADLGKTLDALNAKGYALTHGVHSRITKTQDEIISRIQAGNIYINRNIVGAVVGVQPFGGHSLSGTGPKAGGPFYLHRLSKTNWRLPEVTTPGQANTTNLDFLTQVFNTKCDFSLEQKLELAQLSGVARVNTLRHASQELTGPTGELNTLSWKPVQKLVLVDPTATKLQTARLLTLCAANDIELVVPHTNPLAAYDFFGNLVKVVHFVDGEAVQAESKVEKAEVDKAEVDKVEVEKAKVDDAQVDDTKVNSTQVEKEGNASANSSSSTTRAKECFSSVWSEHPSHLVYVNQLPSLAFRKELVEAGKAKGLIHLIQAPEGQVDVLRLYHEVSVSVNTTASGGNTSLMSLQEG